MTNTSSCLWLADQICMDLILSPAGRLFALQNAVQLLRTENQGSYNTPRCCPTGNTGWIWQFTTIQDKGRHSFTENTVMQIFLYIFQFVSATAAIYSNRLAINTLIRLTDVMYRSCCCSWHFSWIYDCWEDNISGAAAAAKQTLKLQCDVLLTEITGELIQHVTTMR